MPESELLLRFQQRGDLEALVAFAASVGYPEADVRSVVEALSPVFASVGDGIEPDVDRVDRQHLVDRPDAAHFVLRLMAGSHSDDTAAAALRLMSRLGSESFVDDLRRALASERPRLRMEAVRALDPIRGAEARAALEAAASHPDPLIAGAARAALARRHAG